MTGLERLLALKGVIRNTPASDAALAAVSALFGVALPEPLLALWRATDGLALAAADAEILSSAQVLDFMSKAEVATALRENGWLPLIDDHTSNYLCLALKTPLAPRLIDLPHDDSPSPLYRDLESGLAALLASVVAGESFDIWRHEHPGDFDGDPSRSSRDGEDADALLDADDGNDVTMGAQLAGDGNLAKLARKLETDHFVRRDVIARLKRMNSPEVRALLKRDRAEFEAYAEAVAAAAKAAGLEVETLGDTTMKIGRCFIQLEMFFHLRKQPGAMDKTIARIIELNKMK